MNWMPRTMKHSKPTMTPPQQHLNLRQMTLPNLPLKMPLQMQLEIPQLLLFVELLNLMDMALRIFLLSIGQLLHLKIVHK
jgi:hypothetical protein